MKILKGLVSIPIAIVIYFALMVFAYEVDNMEERLLYGETTLERANKILESEKASDEVVINPLYYYYVTDGDWSDFEIYVSYFSLLIDSIIWYLIWKSYREGIYYQARVFGREFRRKGNTIPST